MRFLATRGSRKRGWPVWTDFFLKRLCVEELSVFERSFFIIGFGCWAVAAAIVVGFKRLICDANARVSAL